MWLLLGIHAMLSVSMSCVRLAWCLVLVMRTQVDYVFIPPRNLRRTEPGFIKPGTRDAVVAVHQSEGQDSSEVLESGACEGSSPRLSIWRSLVPSHLLGQIDDSG